MASSGGDAKLVEEHLLGKIPSAKAMSASALKYSIAQSTLLDAKPFTKPLWKQCFKSDHCLKVWADMRVKTISNVVALVDGNMVQQNNIDVFFNNTSVFFTDVFYKKHLTLRSECMSMMRNIFNKPADYECDCADKYGAGKCICGEDVAAEAFDIFMEVLRSNIASNGGSLKELQELGFLSKLWH